MKKYIVKIWESEVDRNQGFADIHEEYSSLDNAVEEAKEIYDNYACVEVIDKNDKCYFHRSRDGFEGFFDDYEISSQLSKYEAFLEQEEVKNYINKVAII